MIANQESYRGNTVYNKKPMKNEFPQRNFQNIYAEQKFTIQEQNKDKKEKDLTSGEQRRQRKSTYILHYVLLCMYAPTEPIQQSTLENPIIALPMEIRTKFETQSGIPSLYDGLPPLNPKQRNAQHLP